VCKIAEKFDLSAENVVPGNGSDEIIGLLARVLLNHGDEAILPYPSFLVYDIAVRSVGGRPVPVPLRSMKMDLQAMLDSITPRTRMVFICNPNNPTGTVISEQEFEWFMSRIPPDVWVVIDEAYIEFVSNPDCLQGARWVNNERPVVVLRTFSKVYGLAGLRIGYGLMPSDLTQLIHRIRAPFNAGSLAQAGAIAALEDDSFVEKTLTQIHSGLAYLYAALDRRGIAYHKTDANFFLILVKDAEAVFNALLKEGVIVRSMRSYGLADCIRVNVGLDSENKRFVDALDRVLGKRA
jgi:histidinol-phosphate aminotransferase